MRLTIIRSRTTSTQRAALTGSAAVDVGFVPIFLVIGTGCLLANTCAANLALTIVLVVAHLAVSTRRARAAAIDVTLRAVRDSVVAGRALADAQLAMCAVAVPVSVTVLACSASRTGTAAVDVRFGTVRDTVAARCALANAEFAVCATAIAVDAAALTCLTSWADTPAVHCGFIGALGPVRTRRVREAEIWRPTGGGKERQGAPHKANYRSLVRAHGAERCTTLVHRDNSNRTDRADGSLYRRALVARSFF